MMEKYETETEEEEMTREVMKQVVAVSHSSFPTLTYLNMICYFISHLW